MEENLKGKEENQNIDRQSLKEKDKQIENLVVENKKQEVKHKKEIIKIKKEKKIFEEEK